MNMGYDIYTDSYLSLPKEYGEKADKVIVEYFNEHEDDFDSYDIAPGLHEYDGQYWISLFSYRDQKELIDDTGSCILHKEEVYSENYTHNLVSVDKVYRPLVGELGKNDIPVSGYVTTDWDSVEHWADFWVDSEYIKQMDILTVVDKVYQMIVREKKE